MNNKKISLDLQLPLFDFANDNDLFEYQESYSSVTTQVAPHLFSDYVVYVDESGDHGLTNINSEYPVFVLAFAIFHKRHYAEKIVPAIEKLKFNYFGHDLIVLHEHEIRKKKNVFTLLNNQELNLQFLGHISDVMQRSNFVLVACVIDKIKLKANSNLSDIDNPYHLALGFCLDGLHDFLAEKGQLNRKTHVLVECRGKKEDKELELEFRRMCNGENQKKRPLPFDVVFVNKQANSTGLQLADLVARPIGVNYFRPNQTNQAFDILKQKFMCREGRYHVGQNYKNYGLKVIPK